MHDAVQVRSLDLKYERRLLLTSFATRESEHATDTAGVTVFLNKDGQKYSVTISVIQMISDFAQTGGLILCTPPLSCSVASPIVTSLFYP